MRVACAHYTKFEEIDLINGININLPDSECFKKDTDISFRAKKKLIRKIYFPYGNLYLEFPKSLNKKIILTTNINSPYKPKSSNVYSYRLNSEYRFNLLVKDS